MELLNNYVIEFKDRLYDIENGLYTNDYNGPSSDFNSDQKVLDYEIERLVSYGLMDVSILKSPNRYILYVIWLHNHNRLTSDPEVIPVLATLVINRLWRFYNKGTKLFNVSFSFTLSSKNFIEQIQKSQIDVKYIVSKCNDGGIYSDTYKEYKQGNISNIEEIMEISKLFRLNLLFMMCM